MLRRTKDDRSLKENLMLASSTAFVAGYINVAGVVAFLAFTANVTGHFANLARHIVENNAHNILVFFLWLMMFFGGAFIANFLARSGDGSRYKANSWPIVIETILLLVVALYGHHFYEETQTEREVIIGAVTFSMGLQNGLVSNISGGLIKTSHLTGLFTDLGSDTAEWFHPRTKKTPILRNRIFIRLTILAFYLFGGLAGGFLFDLFDFWAFYVAPVILLTILYYDLSPLALHKLSRVFGGK